MNKESSSTAVSRFYSELMTNFLRDPKSCNIIAKPPQGSLIEADLKSLCEQSLRDALYSNVQMKNLGLSGCLGVIEASIQLVNLNQCAHNLPFVLLEDMFECITVSECENAFSFVENKIDTWRSDSMLSAGKNYLLRMCNNLLRRLSTFRNTVLCGRIQLFLAQLLPLDEKSALNIMGAFNLDNVTSFATDPEVNEETFAHILNDSTNNDSMDTDASTKAKERAIDYNLYKKFWSLQDYFRNPSQCYDKQKWAAFTTNASTVLKIFAQHKLENVAMRTVTGGQDSDEENVYFPKNLTSEKLFDLQLGDVNFRRHVLVQMLVLFQYLLMKDVKFKPASCQSAPDDMVSWVNSNQEKVYALLQESPPNGDLLVKTLKHIMNREQIWNSWKNAGCPAYVKANAEREIITESPAAGTTTKARTRRTYIGDSFAALREDGAPPSKKLNLGSKELTSLWNIEPDNLKACRAENRRIFPEVKDFFREAAEQLEPGAGVEEEYLLVLKPNYQWCGLRLLARRSTLFFQPNSQFKTVPDFLKAMIDKTFNAKPAVKPESTIMSVDRTSIANGSMTPNRTTADNEKTITQANGTEEMDDGASATTNNEASAGDNSAVVDECRAPSDSEMTAMATHIPKSNLKDLAVQLDFKDEEIDALEKDPDSWCVSMLRQWVEREGEEASVSNLVQSLLDVELPHIVFRVYPKLLPSQYRKKAMEILEETEKPADESDEPMVVS